MNSTCNCRTCRPIVWGDMRFVVCEQCGNKRCPHAEDHRLACTGSNDVGQYTPAITTEITTDKES